VLSMAFIASPNHTVIQFIRRNITTYESLKTSPLPYLSP
jgi:hypothetical protein